MKWSITSINSNVLIFIMKYLSVCLLIFSILTFSATQAKEIIVIRRGNKHGGEDLTSFGSYQTTNTIATNHAVTRSNTVNKDNTGNGGRRGDDRDYLEYARVGNTYGVTELNSIGDEGNTNTIATNGARVKTDTLNVKNPRCRYCRRRGIRCYYC